MVNDRNAASNPGRWLTGLSAKLAALFLLTSAAVLLTGAAGWWILRTANHEIRNIRLAVDGGDAAAMTDALMNRAGGAGVVLAAGVCVCVVLLAGIYLYLVRGVIRPLRIHTRLVSRLAVGDSGEDAPDRQLTRDDEVGDLARAVRDLVTHRREETGIANAIAAGDFTRITAACDPADALGLALRGMAGATIDTLRRVNAHARQITADCETIASAGRGLSAGDEDISAEVAKISPGVAGIGANAAGNADLAERAGSLARAGSQSVERGYENVGDMGVVMLNMQACGDKIVGIAKSIGDIAFQTNLLALNASVEAARAGRNGKGFTIVAQEVRSLAVRTSKAAEETSTLMKETVEQVELAAAIAGRINATFAEMQTNIQEADALLDRIAVASREQSGGIELISAALRRVERSARESMEHVGGILERVDSLARQTGSLCRTMGRFRLDFREPADFAPLSGGDSPGLRAPATSTALTWNPDVDCSMSQTTTLRGYPGPRP